MAMKTAVVSKNQAVHKKTIFFHKVHCMQNFQLELFFSLQVRLADGLQHPDIADKTRGPLAGSGPGRGPPGFCRRAGDIDEASFPRLELKSWSHWKHSDLGGTPDQSDSPQLQDLGNSVRGFLQ